MRWSETRRSGLCQELSCLRPRQKESLQVMLRHFRNSTRQNIRRVTLGLGELVRLRASLHPSSEKDVHIDFIAEAAVGNFLFNCKALVRWRRVKHWADSK